MKAKGRRQALRTVNRIAEGSGQSPARVIDVMARANERAQAAGMTLWDFCLLGQRARAGDVEARARLDAIWGPED